MNDEKKSYSVVGKVEIGTDEYRDLIEAVKDAEARLTAKNSDWYKEYNRANEIEKKLKELDAQYAKYSGFINGSEEIKAKYKLWVFEQQTESMC